MYDKTIYGNKCCKSAAVDEYLDSDIDSEVINQSSDPADSTVSQKVMNENIFNYNKIL